MRDESDEGPVRFGLLTENPVYKLSLGVRSLAHPPALPLTDAWRMGLA